MDASEKDRGPVENANPALCIYIVVYLVVMSFFMINIFVGFVIVTFQEKGENDNEGTMLDRNKVSTSRVFNFLVILRSFSLNLIDNGIIKYIKILITNARIVESLCLFFCLFVCLFF